LTLPAGVTIKDAVGNDAVLTLASPGATGSLGANNAIVVDTSSLVLTLPATIATNATGGQITLASNALGTSSVLIRTLILSVPSGSLFTANTLPTGITAVGGTSGVTTLTLTGTESSLSAYLSTAGNLVFSGTAGATSTLTATVQRRSGTAVLAATTAQANMIVTGSAGSAVSPVIQSLPSTLQITAGESSALLFTNASLDDGNAAVDDTLSLTLGVPTGTLSATGTGSVTVSGTTTSLVLTGKASDLQAFLRGTTSGVGPVRYLGSGTTTTLTIELANSTGGKVSTTATLAATSQATVTGAAASLVVPTTVYTTPGAVVAIPFGAQPLVSAGPVTLMFTGASGASLAWLSDTAVKAASTDATGIAASSGLTVSLYGTPEALNAYLSSGKLKASGAGTVTVSGAGTVTVSGAASATIAISAQTNTSSSRTQPTLNLANTFASAYSNGQIVLAAGALGTGTNTRTVVLSLLDAGGTASTSATLIASSLGASGLSAYISGSVTAVTSGDTPATHTLTLVGTESALSAYLSNAGRLKFNATNGLGYTLRVTAREMSGAAVVSEISKLAAVNAMQPASQGSSGTALVPVINSLPVSLKITTGESSSLVFTGAALDDGNASADETLSIVLSVAAPASGTRSLTAISGSNVTVASGSGTTSLKLNGKASALQSFLQSGSVSYSGDGTTLTVELSNVAGARAISTAALSTPTQTTGSSAALTFSKPNAVTTTPGAVVAIPFNAQSLVSAGPVTLTFTPSTATLSWEATYTGLTVASVTGGVSLTGAPDALNAYLSSAKLKVSGEGTVTVGGAASGTITVTEQANAQATPVLPTLNVPGSFSVATTNGDLALAVGALGTNSVAIRTVIVSISGGATLTANSLGSSALSALGSTSNVSTLTLSGTEAALSAYFATAGSVVFNGAVGSYTLTVTAQRIDGGSVAAQTVKKAAVAASVMSVQGSSGTALAPVSVPNAFAELSTPAQVNTPPGTVAAIPFGAQALVAPGPVALTFTASGGAWLAWEADPALTVASAVNSASLASGSGTVVTIYGAPDDLNRFLSSGKLKAGGVGTIAVLGATSGSIPVVSASTSAIFLQAISYGNSGGAARNNDDTGRTAGGGGGGANGNGGAGGINTTTAGNGGAGRASSITGTLVGYAAGGGGGAEDREGSEQPGTGGAVNGVTIGGAGSNSGKGGNGAANTGSGGGGVGTSGAGGNGGSGVVVVRFRTGDLVASASGITPSTISVAGVGYQVFRFSAAATNTLQITSVNTPGAVVEFLVVGGGGAGGGAPDTTAWGTGGGGAGEMIEGQFAIFSVQDLSVVVGTGGTGNANNVNGASGQTSSITGTAVAISAAGGGGGGAYKSVGSAGGSAGGGGGRVVTAGGTAITRPDLSGLPATLPIATNLASSLLFTGIALDDGNPSADATLTLTLTSTSSSGLLRAATGSGVTVWSGNNTSSLVLSGTASALQAFLRGSSAGPVTYVGPATTLTIEIANGANEVSASIALSPPTQTSAGNASPVLNAPATVLTSSAGPVALPFGAQPLAASGLATLTFTASGGASLAWAGDTGLKVSSTGSVLGSGTGGAMTIYGTPDQLNLYLASGKLKASGSGTVTVTGTVSAPITLVSASGATSDSIMPALVLPSTLTLGSVNGELRLPNLVGGDTEQLTIVLSLSGGPSGGNPSLTVNGSDAAVTVAGSGTATLTLSGSASALRAFLNAQDRVLFNGTASAIAYGLAATLQSRDAGGLVRSAVTGQASVTSVLASASTTAGVAAAPVLGAQVSSGKKGFRAVREGDRLLDSTALFGPSRCCWVIFGRMGIRLWRRRRGWPERLEPYRGGGSSSLVGADLRLQRFFGRVSLGFL
jgi:hypothetical protein